MSNPEHTIYDCLYTYRVSDIISVYDGDTAIVVLDLGFNITTIQKIRVIGINTPELRGADTTEKAAAKYAKDLTYKFLKHSKTLIYSSNNLRGKYGRSLGDFYCGEKNQWLSDHLLELRAAVLYPRDDDTRKTEISNFKYLVDNNIIDPNAKASKTSIS